MRKIKNILVQFGSFIKIKDLNFIQRFRLFRFKRSAIVMTSIAVFLALNLLFSYVSLRADLSKGKAYTLSDSTKTLVRDLKKPVTVTLYASDNIPARLQPLQREAIDLIREYERATGNVKVQIAEFNPTEDQKTVEKITQAGISGVPIREQQQSEVSVTQIYFGIIEGIDPDRIRRMKSFVASMEVWPILRDYGQGNFQALIYDGSMVYFEDRKAERWLTIIQGKLLR